MSSSVTAANEAGDSQVGAAEAGKEGSVSDGDRLSDRDQTRNLILFGANTALSYLASSVTFVIIHAPLCRRLGASVTVANLPSTAYLVMGVLPVFVAWYFPRVALFKRILVFSYLGFAAASALVVGALLLPAPNWLRVSLLVIHGGVTGGTLVVAVSFLFEVLGRGVSAARRGQALGLAYGVGPAFAVLGSLGMQVILAENNGESNPIRNYALLFALSVPVMSLAAYLSSRFVMPLPAKDSVRLPFLSGVFGGLGDFLSARILRIATVVAILTFSGYHIFDNMTLYTGQALGAPPEEYLGYQNGLRFAFKIGTGLLAGWLLTYADPKAVLLLTASLGLAGVGGALVLTGMPYLFCFGLLGGGELFGVYITNYILSCSPPSQMRRNLGFAVMLMLPAAPAGPLFGHVCDYFTAAYSPPVGFRTSFAVAVVFLGVAILLTLLLPARPRPEAREPEMAFEGIGAELSLGRENRAH